jgi:hypothetical protein
MSSHEECMVLATDEMVPALEAMHHHERQLASVLASMLPFPGSSF